MENVLFIFFLPLWVFLFSSNVTATDFHAKVIHIADGDTITVLNEANEQIKIRLSGIDCPEKAQAYGRRQKNSPKTLWQDRRLLSKPMT
jgi:micrococcal nuclease